jgi:hypothetical protein
MMCSMRWYIAARQGLGRCWAVQGRVGSRLTEVTRRILVFHSFVYFVVIYLTAVVYYLLIHNVWNL